MTLLRPEFLYSLLPLLIALYIFIVRRKRLSESYFSKEIMDKLRVDSDSLSLKTRNNLLFLVASLIILAASEPVLEDGTLRVRAIGGDVIIALDVSNSMLAKDVYPNRLELAKKKALEIVEKSTKDRVGVIAFAKNSYLVSPVSFDAKTVSFLLSKLDTSTITQRGTEILTMLETVAKTKSSADKKYLLILSDGGDETDFSAEIDFANENSIMIFVLGMGTRLGASIKQKDGSLISYNDKVVISTLNESISELAIQTGGAYVQNTTSSQDVDAMFSLITNSSERKELKSQEIPRYVALFYYPIILAILFLLIAIGSLGKRVKRAATASAFISLAFILNASPSLAETFDFTKLADAKKLYDAKEYNASAKIYEEYAKRTNNAEAYYNAGNAYYKEKEYLKALSAYSFAALQDSELRAKKLSNMGNALVRLGRKNPLKRAIKHYEASLRLKEDALTRENLEAVKKALKDSEEKSNEDEKKDEKIEYSEQKSDESGNGSDEADDKNNKNKNKNKKKKNKGGSKGKKSDENPNPKSKKKSDAKGSKGESEDNDKGSDGDNGGDGEAKQQTKELKDKNKKEVKNRGDKAKSNSEVQGMSDLEEAKWVKKLNSKQNTYLYRLNEETVKNKEKNEKNW